MGTARGTGSVKLHRLVSGDEPARVLDGERAAVVRHARRPPAACQAPGLAS